MDAPCNSEIRDGNFLKKSPNIPLTVQYFWNLFHKPVILFRRLLGSNLGPLEKTTDAPSCRCALRDVSSVVGRWEFFCLKLWQQLFPVEASALVVLNPPLIRGIFTCSAPALTAARAPERAFSSHRDLFDRKIIKKRRMSELKIEDFKIF